MKIVAFTRAEQGTGASRRLRSAGMTPGIVYGGTGEPLPIKLDHNALFHALRRETFHSSILDMEIDGKAEKVLLRDYQMHAYKPLVLHVDFQRVRADQPIHVKVPLHFLNTETSLAVKQSGGAIHHAVSELDITCLPGDLPKYIEVDLAGLDVGQTIHLSDLKLPNGVSATSHEADMPIVSASLPSAAAAEEETAEEAAAPAAEEAKPAE
ncbi:MAG: 50S ribosomal protein L25/general stress protein Ctc [Oxalobacter formigenes]|nr:50S ribosomal protein L25/general stress protein Ctc [Oxalobacter formigenes]